MKKIGSITAAELFEIRNELKIELKSLLCSSKQGLSEYELKRDYASLFGKEIPFISLGYNNFYELMRSMPDICYAQRHVSGNMWIYYGVVDEQIQNLARLVRGQKTDKNSTKREQFRSNFRSSYNQQFRYNQPANRTYANGNISNMYVRSNPTLIRETPHEVQQQIKQVLSAPKKLSLINFDQNFILQFGVSLDFRQYGFNSLRELFENLPHLVYIEKQNAIPSGSDLVCLATSSVPTDQSNGNVSNLNDSLATSDMNTDSKKKTSREEEEIKENILNLLRNSPEKWFNLIELSIQYEKLYKNAIDYEKFGFKGLDKFVFSLELDNVRFDYTKPYNQLVLNYVENAKQLDNQQDETMSQKERIEDFNKLIEYIRPAFNRNRTGKLYEFFNMFEKYHGWKLDCKQYGFKTNDEMFSFMSNRKLIEVDFDDDNELRFSCKHLYESQSETRTIRTFRSESDTTNHNTSSTKNDNYERERAQYNSDFIQPYVLYKADITNEEVIKQFAAKHEHYVVVSHVTHPCFIEVQLYENTENLEKLMDELDAKYNGWGSSDYDMPESHIMNNRLCASLYADNNWHRCKIVDTPGGSDKVLVNFIDYGGDAWQQKSKIKFLHKDFNLASQAVPAKFANIKYSSSWTKDRASRDKIINYLLNKVAGKILLAKIIGIHESHLSLVLYDQSNKDKPINLNDMIVKEGVGEWYDESKEIVFTPFEKWRNNLLGLKDSFMKKFENALNIFEKNKSNRNETQKDYNNNNNSRVDENNNNTSLNKSTQSKNEEDSLQSRQLKTKVVVYFDPDKKKIYRLNLIDVNKVIYVHWTQVAILFGLSKNVFKEILKLRIKEHDSSLDDLYVKIFILSDQNNELFDTIQNDFNIDLESIDETEELFMLKFYQLYIIASDMLDEEYSKSLETFITNNKVTGKNVNPQLFEEYKKHFNSGCTSEKSLESKDSIKTDSLANIMCDSSRVSVSDLMNIISMLKTSLIFYEENQNVIKIQKTKAKISFYEKKLNELYNIQ